jgi:ABC-type glycerol-3-phosphate transport system permease component
VSVRATAPRPGSEAAQRSRPWSRNPAGDALQLLALLLLALFILLPIYWMASTSLKTANQTFAVPPVFVFEPTLAHYRAVFEEGVVTQPGR